MPVNLCRTDNLRTHTDKPINGSGEKRLELSRWVPTRMVADNSTWSSDGSTMMALMRTPTRFTEIAAADRVGDTPDSTRRVDSEKHRNKQDRDDIYDLDHGVDGRTRGIFVRVANGIAGDRCGVGRGAFAAEITFFDIFFRVVPGAT